MHPLFLRLSWLLISFASACIAVPIGYALVWVVTAVVSVVLFFLWIIGALIGLCVGACIGSAFIGWMTAQAQLLMLGEHQPPTLKLRTISMLIWAPAGFFCLQAYLPISSGDMAPLVPVLVVFAVIASGVQWLALMAHRVPGGFWWGSGGMLGITSGTMAGILLLGALHGRTSTEVLAGIGGTYESIDTVKATQLVEFKRGIVMFVAIEDTNRTNRWELWTSDGTPGGTILIKIGYTGWNEATGRAIAIKDNKLFFMAHGTEDQADSQSYKNGLKTWVTDGTTGGSYPWLDSLSGGSVPHASLFSLEPPHLSNATTTYYVIQKGKRSIELWRRDAASGQETLIKTVP